jgi:hypothetical protein
VAAKIPGVVLDQHQPILAMDDEVMLQGQAEDETARNANLEPFDIAGVDHTAIIPANIDKIAQIANDLTNADGIIAIVYMPNQQTHHNNTIVLNEESNEDNADDNQGNDYNDEISNHRDDEISDDDDNSSADEGGNDKEENNTKELGEGQNPRCFHRKTKGKTSQFDNYNLFLVARQAAQGKPCQAIIQDGVMLFSDNSLSDAKPIPVEDREEFALGVIQQQCSIGAGIKKFGKRAEHRVTKELTQLHDMEVFQPIHKSDLSSEERSKAVSSLMFLKEKRDKSIKGRMCADGRKQRETWTNQESASPTVAMESVFITAVIATHKGRDVGCFDIPGAFLQADSDEDITMILNGPLVELMVQVAPNLYRKYITVNRKNTPILCIKMPKALYGLLMSALLFYRKLVGDLKSNGFVLNPYDPCVANKVINGKQMTVCWHVSDLNM